jgi:hypothetical protein
MQVSKVDTSSYLSPPNQSGLIDLAQAIVDTLKEAARYEKLANEFNDKCFDDKGSFKPGCTVDIPIDLIK